ncbi:Methyl-CpG-binding domain protein-like protein [Emericellopsis cladophorae]|uniref:Methyl-CpG-binding domain protein-like protein n=1 Tax=Emericellopsis cladophorae TaxID=2686198 RepID=A0A9P9Y5U7_9HYPO|nr:Methyl-CpG-binding domain protein-like protein [Emericellopsis cladophorae]KAI6783813.1 Methyl-CpG-binding domain protein-like protein [Emericellopsis cladophorae]
MSMSGMAAHECDKENLKQRRQATHDNTILAHFDIRDDTTEDFILDLINSDLVSAQELELLRSAALTASIDNAEALIECAKSMHRDRVPQPGPGFSVDILDDVGRLLSCVPNGEGVNVTVPWYQTDQMIALIRQQQDNLGVAQATASTTPTTPSHETKKRKTKPSPKTTSHFWVMSDGNGALPAQDMCAPQCVGEDAPLQYAPASLPSIQTPQSSQLDRSLSNLASEVGAWYTDPKLSHTIERCTIDPLEVASRFDYKTVAAGPGSSSPYFIDANAKAKTNRPPPGTVSCVPFPPLDRPAFGLVQEKVAHEPFWLLVAITFLIRTKGSAAIPAFWALKERFPSPSLIADPVNEAEIIGMIRHLGLAMNRLKYFQKYARLFMDNPPRAGQVYRVRKYDRRDMDAGELGTGLYERPRTTAGMLTPRADPADDAEAWEIGHMTHGKYALDSWRIFCRDVLLGRARGWNGEGAAPEFQPEWMRVKPDDKELRACLRWMWMREGFEWDPVTGDRSVLRGELLRAVNERRIEYDDSGGLRIVHEPRQDRDGLDEAA